MIIREEGISNDRCGLRLTNYVLDKLFYSFNCLIKHIASPLMWNANLLQLTNGKQHSCPSGRFFKVEIRQLQSAEQLSIISQHEQVNNQFSPNFCV